MLSISITETRYAAMLLSSILITAMMLIILITETWYATTRLRAGWICCRDVYKDNNRGTAPIGISPALTHTSVISVTLETRG